MPRADPGGETKGDGESKGGGLRSVVSCAVLARRPQPVTTYTSLSAAIHVVGQLA